MATALPLTGERVTCEYLDEMNEFEAKCFLTDYGVFGYHINHQVTPRDVGKKTNLTVQDINYEDCTVILGN